MFISQSSSPVSSPTSPLFKSVHKKLKARIPVSILKYYLIHVPRKELSSMIPLETNIYTIGREFIHAGDWKLSWTSLWSYFNSVHTKYRNYNGSFNLLPHHACVSFTESQIQRICNWVEKYGEGDFMSESQYSRFMRKDLKPHLKKNNCLCCIIL